MHQFQDRVEKDIAMLAFTDESENFGAHLFNGFGGLRDRIISDRLMGRISDEPRGSLIAKRIESNFISDTNQSI